MLLSYYQIRKRGKKDGSICDRNHPMTKEHYLSFWAAVSDNGVQMIKLYSEGDAQARFKIDRVKILYAYCNRHGLFLVRRSDINEAG